MARSLLHEEQKSRSLASEFVPGGFIVYSNFMPRSCEVIPLVR
jgi:hypothetical protein